jgi:hypothetical protein
MKNFATNLEKRMLKTFTEHENMYVNFPIQIFSQNIEVCSIAAQELRKEYDRFKRNRTLKDEIIYYKECFPIIGKWQIYYRYLLELEQSIFISYDEMKIKTYKNCINKLNSDFKKKQNTIIIYYLTIQAKMSIFLSKII